MNQGIYKVITHSVRCLGIHFDMLFTPKHAYATHGADMRHLQGPGVYYLFTFVYPWHLNETQRIFGVDIYSII